MEIKANLKEDDSNSQRKLNSEKSNLNNGVVTKKEILEPEKERFNGSIWLEKKSIRIALISAFSALSVVLGYMLAYLPNIELFTLTIFLSGFILGKKEGVIVGLLSSLIFVFFNPLGASPVPLFIYQIVHYSLTGLIGGFIRNNLENKSYFKPKEDLYVFPVILILGVLGAIITFIYDVISTFIGSFLISPTIEYFIVSYISGIPFTTIHLVGNILGFIFILPGLIQLTNRLLD